MGLELKTRFKKDVDFEILKKYGFAWDTYNTTCGTVWCKGDVVCCSKTGEVIYKKLTQEVFDILIELLIGGIIEIYK